MSWIMMKMGFSDTSATLLCANDWSVMDTLMLFFSGTPDYSPTFLCCMGLPITDMKLVSWSAQVRVLQFFHYYGWQCINTCLFNSYDILFNYMLSSPISVKVLYREETYLILKMTLSSPENILTLQSFHVGSKRNIFKIRNKYLKHKRIVNIKNVTE